MDQLAMLVAQYLHLDMACPAHQFFQVNLVVAEGGQGFAARDLKRRCQFYFILDDAHAASAATPAGFQHQRVANGCRHRAGLGDIKGQGRRCRHHRHAGRLGQFASRHLVAEATHHIAIRADEGNAGLGAGVREFGIFGQEAVARMDGIDLGLLGDANDVVNVEISPDWLLPGPDQIRLVSLEAVQGKAVFAGIDGDGADAEFGCRPQNANGDFAAVGYQQAANGFHECNFQNSKEISG